MAATKEEIRSWLNRAKNGGWKNRPITHVIVVCDTFDWDDYPVYVYEGQDINEEIYNFNNDSMQRIMEVYNMSLDIEDQMNEYRAYHI